VTIAESQNELQQQVKELNKANHMARKIAETVDKFPISPVQASPGHCSPEFEIQEEFLKT